MNENAVVLRSSVATVALAACLMLAGCGSAGPRLSASLPCPAKPDGMLCIKVIHSSDRATVNDVVGYLASSGTSLSGKTWRLALNRYACDPQSGCEPAATYPGPTRHGLPPEATSCRTVGGETVTAPAGCHDTLAQAMASLGDWAGFYGLAAGRPKTFGSRVWLCVAEQVMAGGSWRQPDRVVAPTASGACSSVPAA
jgi:hypothetical protein